LVHIVGITVENENPVLLVDTRARDTMKVWAVLERNQEARESPRAAWLRERRSSTSRKDAIRGANEQFGITGRIKLKAKTWNIFPVVGSQSGTIQAVDLWTNPNAEYVMCMFGKRPTPHWMRDQVPYPLSDNSPWTNEAVRRRLERKKLMLYSAGDGDEPCGYHPRRKGAGGALTGDYYDDAGFPFRTDERSLLWVAIYPDRDTVLPAGRHFIMNVEEGT
jgi:hypothetical protein